MDPSSGCTTRQRPAIDHADPAGWVPENGIAGVTHGLKQVTEGLQRFAPSTTHLLMATAIACHSLDSIYLDM